MNWTMILIGFSLAVLMGAGLASLAAQLRPEWTRRRRVLAAASALPGVTVVATLLALAWISTYDEPRGGNMRDLAAAAIALFGFGFALLALIGGLIGAGASGRGRG